MWVLAPIILAGAVVGAFAWRGRLPSRLMLNAAFSLLLMVYLLVTAGLGIFWVAHQHLPVFDWHYVFGYAMLVLLAVHLAFNFHVMWNTLKRRKAPGIGASATPLRRASSPPRRPWLGALGMLGLGSALGTAYWVGLRQGRTELRVVAGGHETTTGALDAGPAGSARPEATADAAAAAAVVDAFHEFSSHSRAGVFRRAASSNWGARPPPFKALAATARLVLPAPLRAARADGLLTREGLATLLWHTAGVSLERGGIVFRTAPSSGALFAAEFYLAVRTVPGVSPGLWHYQPQSDSLALVRAGEPDAALVPGEAPAALLATAIWRRSGHKYGDRSYRYVLADLGHALENTRQVALALGGSATLLPQFDEAVLAGLLGIDEQLEGVLAHMLFHGSAVRVQRHGPPMQAAALTGPAALGVTEAIHRATSLRGRSQWTVSRQTTSQSTPQIRPFTAAPWLDPLPLIAARRSHRRFSSQALGADVLAQLLAAMTAPAAQLSHAVRPHVLTLAVQGHEPAA